MAQVAMPRRFEAGTVVFKEGDEGSTCYIVRSGRARAIREHPDGRSITLAHFGPGDIFGEMAMLDGERRSATVEATEDTEAIAILSADMHRLLREHPDISVKLIAALGQPAARHQRAPGAPVVPDRAEPGGGGAGRSSWRRRASPKAPRERDVLITATQAELAQLAGSSRESASRFLAVLERAGIITQGRGKLTVHDPEALGRYVY